MPCRSCHDHVVGIGDLGEHPVLDLGAWVHPFAIRVKRIRDGLRRIDSLAVGSADMEFLDPPLHVADGDPEGFIGIELPVEGYRVSNAHGAELEIRNMDGTDIGELHLLAPLVIAS